MPIMQYLESSTIDLSLDGATKEEVLAQLVNILAREEIIEDRAANLDTMLEREGL